MAVGINKLSASNNEVILYPNLASTIINIELKEQKTT